VGDYFTRAITRLDVGILDLAGKAEQEENGLFELRGNTTIRVSGAGQVLRIYDGVFAGHGTVDGNLTLGYDGEQSGESFTTPIIAPGVEDGNELTRDIGTITITQSFEIFSHLATTKIQVDGAGNHDKIVVAGYAVALGKCNIDNSQDYKPGLGTSLSFLTASTLKGEFAKPITIGYTGPWAHPANPGKQHFWKVRKTATSYDLYVDMFQGGPPP
jgi:hypothetical protein